MSIQELDRNSVKMLLDDQGFAWQLDGWGIPRDTGLTASQVFHSSFFEKPRGLRIIAWPRNALLMPQAWQSRTDGAQHSLEICTPRCAPGWATSAHALYCMRGVDWPTSAGGWRNFTAADERVYSLIRCFSTPTPPHCSAVASEVVGHPAWPAASFIAGLNSIALAKLLVMIVDPRWHIDHGQPDREDLLFRFLGLQPSHKSRYVSDEELTARRRLVLSCWKTDGPPRVPLPSQFLWSWWMTHDRDDLSTSLVFVGYLQQTWLDAVCSTQELFVPEYFFTTKQEADEFRKHLMAASK